jgi:hypothetical protein
MEQGHIDYLRNIGIDISQGEHPFAEEFKVVNKTGDPFLIKCFEHLLLMLILDIETIKNYNTGDYEHYIKRLRATNSSFWGQRFEVSWYSLLISKMKNKPNNLRRGQEGEEADFVFEYKGEQVSIETTSVVYELTSSMTNPIIKIKGTIGKKDKMKYADKNCCLVIDYTNLSFYRKILKNFKSSISDLIGQMESRYGAVLFHESFHSGDLENPRYFTQVYDWTSETVNPGLMNFLSDNLTNSDTKDLSKVYFRVG